MKKLLLLSALLIFACSSDLFAQDYMKMNKKNLRVEYQKKIKLIDSLSQELSLSNKKSQNLQSDLNNSSNDLILTSDSLKNSNLEINQLEVKLLASKNELGLLVLEIDNLVKQNSDNLDLITDKNLQIDSLRTSLNNKSRVTIGNQVWTNENLNVIQFRNGDKIIESKTVSEWNIAANKKQPTWRYYNFDKNYSHLGKFYNYYAASDHRDIAPKGWRVATVIDYINLISYIDPNGSFYKNINDYSDVGGALKIKGYWENYCEKDATGFNAIPYNDEIKGKIAYFWCITKWSDMIDLIPEKDKDKFLIELNLGELDHKAGVFRIRDGTNCFSVSFDDDPKTLGYNIRLIKE